MDLHPHQLALLRDELARGVAESNLSHRARELSLSRRVVRAVLAGAVPSARTRERLVLWYGERVLQRMRAGATREAALQVLVDELPPEAAERARERILEALEEEAFAPRVVCAAELVAQLNAELARREVPEGIRFRDGVLRYWRPEAAAAEWDQTLGLEGDRARRYAEVAGLVIRWGRGRFALAES